jgi:hypothetical protein
VGDDVSPWGTTVMSIAGGQLRDHWATTGNEPWSRTLYTGGLDSIGAVVTGLWDASLVNISHGCVTPSLQVTSPTADDPAKVGPADDPSAFIVRTRVTGAEGQPVSGLSSDAYEVTIKPEGLPGPVLPATVISGVDTQGAYWLLVQAPDDIAGAVTDGVYDVTVTLPGGETDTQVSALAYTAHKLDRIVVLDRSGSMGGGTGKIEAARGAARLLMDELAGTDQGGYVAFHHDAALRVALAPMNAAQRTALENSIQAELAAGNTSIGDGLATAATEEDAHGSEENGCAFALLSDGYENDPAYWDDVKAGVLDNGCAIDAVAFGPEANEAHRDHFHLDMKRRRPPPRAASPTRRAAALCRCSPPPATSSCPGATTWPGSSTPAPPAARRGSAWPASWARARPPSGGPAARTSSPPAPSCPPSQRSGRARRR